MTRRKEYDDCKIGATRQLCYIGYSFSTSPNLSLLRRKAAMGMCPVQDYCENQMKLNTGNHVTFTQMTRLKYKFFKSNSLWLFKDQKVLGSFDFSKPSTAYHLQVLSFFCCFNI